MRGRPKKDAADRHFINFAVRLTHEEMSLIRQAAKLVGDKTAPWARQHLLTIARLTVRRHAARGAAE
jgi:uncharacterized protein (DUF1778 family)